MSEEADMDNMKTMVGPAMRMMNELTKDIKSENVVAEFVEVELKNFFTKETEMASAFLIKMMIQDANNNPQEVLRKFLTFYNAFRVFYGGLQNSKEADENPPVEEEDDATRESEDKD